MNTVKQATLLLFLTRPIVLVPVWGFALFGYRIASFHSMVVEPFSFADFGLIVLFSISVAAVYLLNQREDFDVDSKNGGYPLMVKAKISQKTVTIFAAILASLSVISLLFVGSFILAFLAILSIVIGWLYSCKPAYFTGRPVADFLSNAIGFGLIAYAAGWFVGGGYLSGDLFKTALPYILLMCAGSVSSTLPDISGDRNGGKITTAVKIGEENAHILASFFLAAGSISGALLGDLAAVLCGTLASPFYLVHLLKPTAKTIELPYKAGGGFMMLIIAITYPIFGIISLFVGIVTFFYFKIVHKVTYPSLRPLEPLNK